MHAYFRTTVCALGVCLFALGGPAAAEPLRIAIAGDLNRLDPHSLNETLSLGLLGNVYEGLTRRDANLKIVPGLATRWETLTPTHWRIHLRRGVTFHDGSAFSADDVVFSLARARSRHSQLKRRIPEDARVVKIDPHTVDILLGSPMPILHHAWDTLYIMSRGWAERNGMTEPKAATQRIHAQAALKANGTGPFRIVSHRPGARTEFVRNSRWWGKPQNAFSKVVVDTVRAAPTRSAALLSGQVDAIVPAPLGEVDRLRRSPKVRLIDGLDLRTMFLMLDSFRDELLYSSVRGKNPFKDARVRRAIYQAINIEAVREKLMLGFSKPSALLISPDLFPLGRTFERHPFDIAAAKSLMKAAGYGSGFAVTLDCPNNRYVNDEAICIAIANMLRRIDIRVEVRAVPKARFFERVTATSRYDSSMSFLGWTPGTMDALEILLNLAVCRDAEGNGGLFNLGGYCNREVDRLAAEAAAETNLGRRDRLIAQAFRIIHEEAGLIPLHQQPLLWGLAHGIDARVRADNQIHFDLFRKHGDRAAQR